MSLLANFLREKMSHLKAHASFTVISYAGFYIPYFFCLVAPDHVRGRHTHPEGPTARPRELGGSTAAAVEERSWMTTEPPGAPVTPAAQEEIMTRRVTQPTGSDAILSLVPGNGPGMTKKIITL